MVEFHVDTCHIFEERGNNGTKFGGKKPLIMFGHDECTFKQYTLTKKHWKAPNGTVILLPKDDGQGVMISSFQSQEFGFRVQINNQELTLINNY
jgi:hypothetical protein